MHTRRNLPLTAAALTRHRIFVSGEFPNRNLVDIHPTAGVHHNAPVTRLDFKSR